MGYDGYEVPIALGQLGLQTDGPQSQLPPNAALVANNVAFYTGLVAKSNGTSRYNSTTLGNPIVVGFDWWPTATQQRMIVATSDGKIWKDTGDGTFSSGVNLPVNETQWIQFSSIVTGGFVQWKWNGNSATGFNNGGVDTPAQVQTQLRTISGLSLVTVSGDWSSGFTVVMPGTSSSQPLITTNVNGLLGTGDGDSTTTTGVSQWIKFATPVTGGTVTWGCNGLFATGTNAGGTDTASQVQTQLRTITGLSTVTVVGNWTQGFVVTLPGVYTDQPLIFVCPVEAISFSSVPVGGSVTWQYNGVAATGANTGGTDTAAQVQTQMRTIPALSLCVVSGSWSTGFTVSIPQIAYPALPITTSANTLVNSSSGSVTITVTEQKLTDASSNTVVTTVTQAQLDTVVITHIQIGATGLGTITTDSHMVAGGNEVQGNPRRLFIYSGGTSQVAMMTADSASVTGITRPAADWVSTFPTFGTIYNSRHCAFLHHTLYVSKLADHTDFTTSATDGTGAAQFPIFPGEGDAIIGAAVFKGGLLIFKKPFGMYLFQWNGGDITNVNNVSTTKISDSFATASPHSYQQVLDDFFGGSSSGSIFSLKATNAYGNFEAGDILQRALVRNYFRQNFDYSGLSKMQSAYYPEKFLAMFSGRDNSGSPQNRILTYDAAGQAPRIAVETKDQPTCLFMRKDSNAVLRPFYGSDDGFVYKMDQSTFNVNGSAYVGEFQTPYIDFSFLDPKLADKNKLFDFLNVAFQSVGAWAFYVDVYVDGVFIQTLTYNMKQTGAVLDSFVLDVDKLGGTTTAVELRQPLKSCSGKTISFRVYNGLLNQNFIIERLTVSFRPSGEQNRSSK